MDKRKAAQNEEEETHGMNQTGLLIRLFGTFWGTVVAVEIMDIAFSVDSVLAAFGVSEQVWVLLVGGMLGVLMMRGIAGVFLKLIDRVPELETSAYILILLIALKMFVAVFNIHVPHAAFFSLSYSHSELLLLFTSGTKRKKLAKNHNYRRMT